MIDLEFTAGLSGRQNVEVLKNGKVIRETGFHKNMILNAGFDAMTKQAQMGSFHFIVVGTGTSAVDPAQTALGSFLAGYGGSSQVINPTYTELGLVGSHREILMTRVATFPESSIIGNITEIGTGKHSNSTTVSSAGLGTRALILDVAQQPTSISIQAGEQLRVTHEMKIRVPVATFTQVFPVTTGGVTTNHTVEMQACNVNGGTWGPGVYTAWGNSANQSDLGLYSGAVGLNFGANNGNPSQISNISNIAATMVVAQTGIYAVECTNTYSSTQMNHASGLGGLFVGSFTFPRFAIKITPALPKNNLNKLVMKLRIVFARD